MKKFQDRKEMTGKINHFASAGIPFLFAVDADAASGFVFTPEEASEHGIRWTMEEQQDTMITGKDYGDFRICPPGAEEYRAAFAKVMHHLRRGDTYLLNLTFPTNIETGFTLEEIYLRSRARFRMLVPGQFVVFSPEPFVRTRHGYIHSNPMKGTILAELPGAAELLLSDRKEFFEHNTIVDLIRNDLAMVSTGVEVTRFRYIERIPANRGDLLQMSSEIRGRLAEGYLSSLGDILFTLLPAGSVTGAPKERTLKIIREAESSPRGFYTGIFGWFDGRELTSAVTIRYIEQTDDGMVFRSGGGITALSDPEKEYQELISKVYVPFV